MPTTQHSSTRSDLQIAQLQDVMERLQRFVPEAVERVGACDPQLFDNALLNIAVSRIRAVEGGTATAAILWRLADAVASGAPPAAEEAVELTRMDS